VGRDQPEALALQKMRTRVTLWLVQTTLVMLLLPV
jgi:hypothetical protein